MTDCRRYFFHASENRKSDAEYLEEDDEEMHETGEFPPSPASSQTEPEDEEEVEAEKAAEAQEESDPELADWFKVGGKDVQKGKSTAKDDDTDSETEPESDNEDVRDDNDALDDLDDDWFNVPTAGTVSCVVCWRTYRSI